MLRLKHVVAIICIVCVFSCKKSGDSSNTGGFSTSSTISYKVNGAIVSVNGDYNTQAGGLGISFVHIAGTATVANHYILTASSTGGNLLGLPIVASNFAVGTYTTPIDGTAVNFGASLVYNGKNYASGLTSDPTLSLQINITNYSGSRANGTFSGKLVRVVSIDPQGNVTYDYAVITEGQFSNVIVN